MKNLFVLCALAALFALIGCGAVRPFDASIGRNPADPLLPDADPLDNGTYLGSLVDAAQSAADAGNFSEAVRQLDILFAHPKACYVPGLGVWASRIYEGAENFGKSLLFACLDVEYFQSVLGADDDQYRENLDRVETLMAGMGHLDSIRDDLLLVRGGIPATESRTNTAAGMESGGSPCFLRDYFLAKNKILAGHASVNDVQLYLSHEGFFKISPAFYATAWNGCAILSPSNRSIYLPVLEKTLLLRPEKNLARQTRTLIGQTIGLDSSQSGRLLLLPECAQVMELYQTTQNPATLEPLFQFFELPDNGYVFSALVLAKKNRALLESPVRARLPGASPKLAERLKFVLQ
jgi:hypothetical protein